MADENFVFSDIKTVPIDSLELLDSTENPNQGDIEAIAESLQINGLYHPLKVRESNNKVLGGNHTLMAAKQLGWETIQVVTIDCDDVQAKRIILADNMIPKLGKTNDKVLADIFATMPNVVGTGYKVEQVDSLIERNREMVQKISDMEYEEVKTEAYEVAAAHNKSKHWTPDEGETITPLKKGDPGFEELKGPYDDVELDEFQSADMMVEGKVVNADTFFETGMNPFDIPHYDTSMFVEEMPEGLRCWAGRKGDDFNADHTWVWIYGQTPARKLPWHKTIVSFWTQDNQFERLWADPVFYAGKLYNMGARMAVEPDFSLWHDDPVIFQLYNLYRSRWLARYMQETGIKIIPQLQANPSEIVMKATMYGLPTGLPVMAVQLQTYKENVENERNQVALLAEQCRTVVKPQNLIVYGGHPATRMIENLDWGLDDEHIHWVPSYAWELNRLRQKREEMKTGVSAREEKKRAERKEAKAEAKDLGLDFNEEQFEEQFEIDNPEVENFEFEDFGDERTEERVRMLGIR